MTESTGGHAMSHGKRTWAEVLMEWGVDPSLLDAHPRKTDSHVTLEITFEEFVQHSGSRHSLVVPRIHARDIAAAALRANGIAGVIGARIIDKEAAITIVHRAMRGVTLTPAEADVICSAARSRVSGDGE